MLHELIDVHVDQICKELTKNGFTSRNISGKSKKEILVILKKMLKKIHERYPNNVFSSNPEPVFESTFTGYIIGEVVFIDAKTLNSEIDIDVDVSDIYYGNFITLYPLEEDFILDDEEVIMLADYFAENGRADLALKIRGDVC